MAIIWRARVGSCCRSSRRLVSVSAICFSKYSFEVCQMRTVQISSSPKLWRWKYNVTSINVSRIRIHPFNLAYDHSKYESHYTMQIMHVLEKKTSYKAYDKFTTIHLAWSSFHMSQQISNISQSFSNFQQFSTPFNQSEVDRFVILKKILLLNYTMKGLEK